MKAVGYTEQRSLEDEGYLIDLVLPVPRPEGRDLLVRVKAVSVNPVDLKAYQRKKGNPVVLGFDAAGVVDAAGPDARLFKPGDQVFYAGAVNRPGSNAELQLVDERIVGRKPKAIGFADAASLPLTSLTAYELMFELMDMPRDDSEDQAAMILGGAGGVASISIQLARALTGVQVIGSASREASRAWVTRLGAHHVIDHTKPYVDQLQAAEVDSVHYIISTHTTPQSWAECYKAIAPFGRIGVIDDPEPLDIKIAKQKSLTIITEGMFTRPVFETSDMIRQHEILDMIAALVDRGLIRATTGENYGPITAANLTRAHRTMAKGSTIGKIVLEGF